MDTKLQPQVDALLAEPLSNFDLLTRLDALFREHQAEVADLDGQWALTLFERAPSVFYRLINEFLPTHSPVFEPLLARSEAEAQDIFTALYARVATPKRWNADVLHLLEMESDYDRLYCRVEPRIGQGAIPTEDTLIALYDRDPDNFVQYYGQFLRYQSGGVFVRLPNKQLTRFRAFVRQRTPDAPLWFELMARYSTQAEFDAEVERWLREKPNNLTMILRDMAHWNIQFTIPDEKVAALIQLYGDTLIDGLRPFNETLLKRRIDEIFQAASDDRQLYDHLNKLAQTNWRAFESIADHWAMRLYERDPSLFISFLIYHTQQSKTAQDALLERAERDGRDDFYRELFARAAGDTRWNDAVRAALADSPDLAALTRRLDRIDVRKAAFANPNVTITDDLAAALYRRAPVQFGEMIYRYLRTAHPYPLLLAAIQEEGDMDFFSRIFRKAATASQWEKEMEALLAQDIPADRILDELERRKPANVSRTNPAILTRFLEKYGNAVMPFFENYLDWTHPKRLQALLALDLDRGTLLRELNAIARRQPEEFAQKAHIWAIPLYEKGGAFFSTFFVRYLNRWRAGDVSAVGEELLRRSEADGHERMFRDLYARFYWGADWHHDIAVQMEKYTDDDALVAVLERRGLRGQLLSDQIAAALYTRNPDLFRPFVLTHTRNRWQQQNYPRLKHAAEERGDTELLERLIEQENPAQKWKRDIERILQENVPPDEISARLRAVLPQDTWRLDMPPLIPIVEKYGEAVVPFLISFTAPMNSRDFYDAIKQRVSPTSYWRLMFRSNYQIPRGWFDALKQAADIAGDAAFQRELAILTPESSPIPWSISEDIALALYRRSPALTRSFIQRFFNQASIGLLELAEQNDDIDLVDYMLYRMLTMGAQLVARAFPQRGWYANQPDKGSLDILKTWEQLVIPRLDRMHVANPEGYVRRAAHIMSMAQPFELGWQSAPDERHAIWTYLATRYHDDWRRSPAAITELLESPNIFVQILGFEILSSGGVDAARRVVENLRMFRAFLFSGARRNAKHKALTALAKAAESADPEGKARILALLAEAAEYKAKRSVADDAATALVLVQISEGVN